VSTCGRPARRSLSSCRRGRVTPPLPWRPGAFFRSEFRVRNIEADLPASRHSVSDAGGAERLNAPYGISCRRSWGVEPCFSIINQGGAESTILARLLAGYGELEGTHRSQAFEPLPNFLHSFLPAITGWECTLATSDVATSRAAPAMPQTPSSPPPATTSGASSPGSGCFCA
jgi:hypothetical protein